MPRSGLFVDRTPAVGGHGYRFEFNERELEHLLASEGGPVGRWLVGTIGPAVVQEAKRLAPVSKDGNYGRPSGYLRSSIGAELHRDAQGLVLSIGSHALTPRGTDYGYIQEVKFTPHLRPALDVLRRL